MSYDLYCYIPTSAIPNSAEAEAIINSLNADEEAEERREPMPRLRERVTRALIAHNPRLQRFAFNYAEVAESLKITEEQARERFTYAELNPPEGDLAIQLTVHENHVEVTIPYWYEGDTVDRMFAEVSAYLRVVRRAGGYFAYDPQTGLAFDPEQNDLRDHRAYDLGFHQTQKIAAEGRTRTKPWWKVW